MKIAYLVVVTVVVSLWLFPERPLTFVLEPHNDSVTEGSSYSLRSQSSQPCEYQWFKDGEVLPGATNSTLIISYMLEGDSGTYYVVAKNNAGIITSRTVVITYNPVIHVAIENDTVTLDADGPIHFTTDGTEPTLFSPLYVTPIVITEPCVLRATSGRVEMEYVRFVLDKRQDVPTTEQ